MILSNGCASPHVKYATDPELSPAKDDGYPKFYLQASNILLQLEETPNAPSKTNGADSSDTKKAKQPVHKLE
jgi:hypothetical protein